MVLKDASDEVITDIRYEVYYDGNLIDSADLDFTAANDGKYTVVAIGKYGTDKELLAYKEAVVSVFSTTDIGIIDKQAVSTISILDKINTIMEYADAKTFTTYRLVRIIGPNEIEVANAPISADGVITITNLASGYYKIYATDASHVDEVAYIDIWDSVEGHMFNYVSEDTLDYVLNYRVYSWGIRDYAEFDEISVTQDGNFFASTFPSRGNSLDNAVKVYPLHSKAYYEQFRGLNGIITFDYYIDSDNETTSYRPIGTSGRPNINSGFANKLSISISLDEFLDNWDDYNSSIYNTAYTFLIKELGWVWMDKSTTAITMYVGNFKFTYTEVAEVENPEINLVDVNGMTSYDLSGIISAEGQAVIADGYSYVLSCDSYDVKLGTSSVVDVTAVENQRLFTLKVYDTAGFLQYKGYVDLYDSSAAPVWNSVDEKSFALYSGPNTRILTDLSKVQVEKGGVQVMLKRLSLHVNR